MRDRPPPPPPSPSCLPLQTGEVSAAAGAGQYCEERRAQLTSLWLLLQAQVPDGRRPPLPRPSGLPACLAPHRTPALPTLHRPPHPPHPRHHFPSQVLSAGSLPPALYQAVAGFNADLLAARGGGGEGRCLLVQRLVELVRVGGLVRGGGGVGRVGGWFVDCVEASLPASITHLTATCLPASPCC